MTAQPNHLQDSGAAERAADGNSYRYHATGLPAGGDRDPSDYFQCAKCGALTHIDDLDGKPEPRFNWFFYRSLWLWWTGKSHASFDDPEGSTDWERLECGDCYGPGYSSNRGAA